LLGVAGLVGLAAGEGLARLGVCPVVKRIWTPSWVLFSGGWCFLLLAGFYAVIDAAGWRGWSYPLRVVGRNSIAAYLMHWLFEGFIKDNIARHLGPPLRALADSAPARALGEGAARWMGAATFDRVVATAAPLAHGASVLVCFWLILWWMDRKRIYLKV
jgi:predicted acyltransferase